MATNGFSSSVERMSHWDVKFYDIELELGSKVNLRYKSIIRVEKRDSDVTDEAILPVALKKLPGSPENLPRLGSRWRGLG